MADAFPNLTPRISKAEFDSEAIAFLQKYYPEALQSPMAIPIEYVARHRMGLRVVERRLTEDLSVLGQMCFTSGITEIYDLENDEYKVVKVRYGTMIIDPDIIRKRNAGCKNNTVAHECFHWYKHRDFYIATSIQDKRRAIKQRCDYQEKSESTQTQWTDEDWMEWQARGIAPRILLPLSTFSIMVEHFIEEYSHNSNIRQMWFSKHAWVVNSLANFFNVSKQSVEIRLEEIGYFLRC